MGAPWRRWGCEEGWRSRQRRCPRRSGDRRGHLYFVSTADRTIRPRAQAAILDVLNPMGAGLLGVLHRHGGSSSAG
jgi:hypothetical protein